MTSVGQSLTTPDPGWKRVESTEAFFSRVGAWSAITGATYTNNHAYYSITTENHYEFRFTGQKFRIIEALAFNKTKRADVYVNGVFLESFSQYSDTVVGTSLVYEKVFAEVGNYTIRVVNKGASGEYFTFDALDFETEAELLPLIGAPLASPASGWRRHDNLHPSLQYKGAWSSTTAAAANSGEYARTTTVGDSVSFKFTGKQIRLIGPVNLDLSTKISVRIDGKEEIFSTYSPNLVWGVLLYEKAGLADGEHSVTITAGTTAINILDAVDLPANERLLHPNEVSSMKDLAVGKKIRAHYRAASGQQGSITRIGEETAAPLNTGTILNPMGDFYFVAVEEKNGTKKLIADRPLQTTIASDTLNTAGYHHTGVPIGSTIYVDAANGLDTNPGTVDRPIKTLARALVSAPYSGTVKLGKGTYSASTLHDLTTTKGLTYVGENQDTAIEIQSCPANYSQPIATAAYFRNLVIQPSATFSGDTRFIWYNTSSAVNYYVLRFENVLFKPSPSGQYPSATLFAWTNSGAAFPNVLLKNCTSLSKTPIDGASTRSIDCVYAGAATHSTTPTVWSNCLVNATIDTEFHVAGEEKRSVGVFTGKYAWGSYRFREPATELLASLMSGGISAADKDNDWDRFVVSSSLNGTITPGDATFWNITSLHNLTRTTPVNGTADRVVRGYGSVTAYFSIVGTNGNAATAYSSVGFRPVLLVSDLSRLLVLFRDGDVMKALVDGTWQVVGTYPATPEMFTTYGMTAPLNVTLQQLRLLGTVKPYVYTDSATATTMSIQGVLSPVLIRAKGDLRLDGVEQIDALTLAASATGSAQAKVIVSKDKGLTWEAYRNGNWMTVDADDLSDVSVKGMTAAELNATPPSAWDTTVLAGQVRFAYYLERTTADEKVAVDALSAQFDMRGRWKKAIHGTDYDYAYPTNSSLQVSLLSDGSYKINYADASTGSGGGGSVTWEEF